MPLLTSSRKSFSLALILGVTISCPALAAPYKCMTIGKGTHYEQVRKLILAYGYLPGTPETGSFCTYRNPETAAICEKAPEIAECYVEGYCDMKFIQADGDGMPFTIKFHQHPLDGATTEAMTICLQSRNNKL